MPDVNCTVNSCHYWQNGNLCNANHIFVQTDDAGGFSPNANPDTLQATPANSKDATCCQTFKKH